MHVIDVLITLSMVLVLARHSPRFVSETSALCFMFAHSQCWRSSFLRAVCVGC